MTNQPSYTDWKLDLFTCDQWWIGETMVGSIDQPLEAIYATQLMAEAGTLLDQLPIQDLGDTLWFLLNQILNIDWAMVPDSQTRLNFMAAIRTLFRDLYDPHCAPVLGHLDEQPATPLNLSCYMWWDVLPIPINEASPHENLAIASLATMDYCLHLNNLACKESALHGLGHFQSAFPEAVAKIIKDGDRHIPEKLQPYAQQASIGCIQ
ncbi:MAG: hypothetical protein WBB82_07210 [Limnothrix sp.]